MIFNLSISRIREFINQERVYMLMLSFILLFNALIIFSQKIPELSPNIFKEKQTRLQLKESTLEDEQIIWTKVLEKKSDVLTLVNILSFLVISVFSLGLFLDIRILTAKLKKREILQTSGAHSAVRWGIWDIARLTIIFVFLGYILNIIEAPFLSAASKEKGGFTFFTLLNTGVMDLLILGFIIYFVTVKYSQNLRSIGLKLKGALKNIFLALLSYVAFLPILTAILLFLIWLASLLNYQPPPQALFKLFLEEKRTGVLIYSTLMVVFLGPIVEEIFFRGFSYNALKKRWGGQRAMALTAVVFAALHGNLIGFFPIMALGFLLVYVYEKTGSLIPSITIHILHNSSMVGLLFLGRYFVNLVK